MCQTNWFKLARKARFPTDRKMQSKDRFGWFGFIWDADGADLVHLHYFLSASLLLSVRNTIKVISNTEEWAWLIRLLWLKFAHLLKIFDSKRVYCISWNEGTSNMYNMYVLSMRSITLVTTNHCFALNFFSHNQRLICYNCLREEQFFLKQISAKE